VKKKLTIEQAAEILGISRYANFNVPHFYDIQTERTVNRDNTVSYKGKNLQIDRKGNRYSYAKTKVKVPEYANGKVAIYYGHTCLGRYDQKRLSGQEVEKIQMTI